MPGVRRAVRPAVAVPLRAAVRRAGNVRRDLDEPAHHGDEVAKVPELDMLAGQLAVLQQLKADGVLAQAWSPGRQRGPDARRRRHG